jgi:hypothetical protein
MTHSGVDQLVQACESALAYIGMSKAEAGVFFAQSIERARNWLSDLQEIPKTQ